MTYYDVSQQLSSSLAIELFPRWLAFADKTKLTAHHHDSFWVSQPHALQKKSRKLIVDWCVSLSALSRQIVGGSSMPSPFWVPGYQKSSRQEPGRPYSCREIQGYCGGLHDLVGRRLAAHVQRIRQRERRWSGRGWHGRSREHLQSIVWRREIPCESSPRGLGGTGAMARREKLMALALSLPCTGHYRHNLTRLRDEVGHARS